MITDRLWRWWHARMLRGRGPRTAAMAEAVGKAFTGNATESERIHRLRRAVIRCGNAELAKLPDSWWSSYIRLLQGDEQDAALVAATAGLDGKMFSSAQWLELYRLCWITGIYRVAMSVRVHVEACVKAEADKSQADARSLRLALAIAIEKGQLSDAAAWLEKLSELGSLDPEKLAHGRWLVELLNGRLQPLALSSQSDAESNTLQEISGASVALVGPAPFKARNGSDIDGFDWVAKFNYRGGAQGCDPQTQGRRVDIAYYNLVQSKFITKELDASFLRDLRFPVFIKEKGFRLLGAQNQNSRPVRNLEWALLDTELNAGPNAALDILRFNPARLKVFNTDLMLTGGRFAGYREPGAKEVNYSHSFAKTHDPVLQFRIFQQLFQKGILEGDDRFVEVMEMTLHEYIARLEEAHGGIAREAVAGIRSPAPDVADRPPGGKV